jgi:hypothetical protein
MLPSSRVFVCNPFITFFMGQKRGTGVLMHKKAAWFSTLRGAFLIIQGLIHCSQFSLRSFQYCFNDRTHCIGSYFGDFKKAGLRSGEVSLCDLSYTWIRNVGLLTFGFMESELRTDIGHT